jgi:hypothetical protein
MKSAERQEHKAKEVKTVECMLGKEHLAHHLLLCALWCYSSAY